MAKPSVTQIESARLAMSIRSREVEYRYLVRLSLKVQYVYVQKGCDQDR